MRAISLFLLSVTLFSQVVFAAATVTVDNPYIAATFAKATSAAGYGTLHNNGSESVVLIGVKVATSVAAAASLHRTTIEDDMTSMRALPQVEIAAGDQVVFEPGARHIMLTGLVGPLQAGQTIPLTLIFKDGTTQPVDFAVRAADAHAHRHHEDH